MQLIPAVLAVLIEDFSGLCVDFIFVFVVACFEFDIIDFDTVIIVQLHSDEVRSGG